MYFANVNGARKKPFKDGHGYCPLCGSSVVAHCGEIERHHWQHSSIMNCDSWHEPITQWHLAWQDKFPIEWCEIIIEDKEADVKHRADIKTAEGLVIEFQNSSISSTEIRNRESFYGDMIWVINAQAFKDNFYKASRVRRELRDFDNDLSCEEQIIKDLISEEVTEQKKKVNEIDGRLNKEIVGCNYTQNKIKNYQGLFSNVERISIKIIRSIFDQEEIIGPDIIYLFSHIKQAHGDFLLNTKKSIHEIRFEIERTERRVKELTELEDYKINGKDVKKISPNTITPDWSDIFYVKKATKNTLFPDYGITTFGGLNRRLIEENEFFVDITENLLQFRAAINDLEIEEDRQEEQLEKIKKDVFEEAKQWLSKKLCSLQEELRERIKRRAEIEDEYNKEKACLDNLNSNLRRRLEGVADDLKKKYRDKRFQIMKDKKGLYICDWKHERKSWRAATRYIFFDVGENYLFQKIKHNEFKKITIEDFMAFHLRKAK